MWYSIQNKFYLGKAVRTAKPKDVIFQIQFSQHVCFPYSTFQLHQLDLDLEDNEVASNDCETAALVS